MRTAPKKIKSKKPTSKKHPRKAKSALERRKTKRFELKNLKATEVTGDYIYSVLVKNISEGGIFLGGHLKTNAKQSELTLKISASKRLSLHAEPIYDQTKRFGTAYRFIGLNSAQKKSLREFLSKLK